MNKKLSENLFFSMINQVVSVIMPLITGPYIARVLLPEQIGSYSYVLANSSYFLLLGSLGLAQHGMIQTAKNRNDKQALSCVFWEILFFKILLTGISLGLYFVLLNAETNPTNRVLYWIMTINILANMLDLSWLFNGLEDFKTMTIRGILVRIAAVIAIVVLVRDKNDFFIYALIMQGTNLIGNCAVFPILKDQICWPGFSSLNIIKHLKPSMVYFVPGIVHVIFTSVDKTMLGAMISEYEVGIYEQATKITTLCAGVLNSVSNVLLARATYLFHNSQNTNSADSLMATTLKVGSMLILPVSLGTAAISQNVVPLLFGPGYEKSAYVLQVLSFQVLFSTMANYYAHQCMISRGHQKEYNVAIISSSIVNVLMNLLLIPRMTSIGAALASVLSNVVTLGVLLHYGRNIMSACKLWNLAYKYILAAIVMYFLVVSVPTIENAVFTTGIQIMVGAIAYVICIVILKDQLVMRLLSGFKGILKRKI